MVTYATIAFFAVYGLSKFVSFKHASKILGILGFLVAIGMIVAL